MALSGSFNTKGYDGRYWKFSWSATQSVTNNTSTISWRVDAVGGNVQWYKCGPCTVVVAGSTVYNNTGRWVQYTGMLCSGTVTVAHDSSGNASFAASITSAIYYGTAGASNGVGNGSGSFTLNTIARASQPSITTYPNTVSSVTMGDSLLIHMNRKSGNFTHKVTATFGSKSEVIATACTSNVRWDGFTVEKYANQIPNATNGKLVITVVTMNGSTTIGTKSVTVTANLPTNIVPQCTITSIQNTNPVFTCYAASLSGVKVIPHATGIYGSTIKTIIISVTEMKDKSATSDIEYTFDPFQTAGDKFITVTATDSRGRTATAEFLISVSTYLPPTSNISVCRGDGDSEETFVESDTGSYAKITCKGSVYTFQEFLGRDEYKNEMTPVLQYRVSGQPAWSTIPISSNSDFLDTSIIVEALDTEVYEFRLIIRDKSGNETSSSYTLPNGFATLDFLNGGQGIAFGKTANRIGFDCSMLMRILNGAYIMSDTPGDTGWMNWYYNMDGEIQKQGEAYVDSDGFHLKSENGKGFLDGTWSGVLSDQRMKRDIEPVTRNIIKAVGEVPFVQFRMSAPGYDHDELCVGILAQDLQAAFARYGVSDKLLMLGTKKINPHDKNEYYCIEYTHFLIVRLLYDEIKMQDYDKRLTALENKVNL